ncbi:MAG TPA: proline dehydrogenase family protein [Gaiellaceae bacterium]|nr:proline dehydrogenase family protein [Gaiellaceae bacterium]
MQLVNRAIVGSLPLVPRAVVRRLSSRYIAGSTLDDAVRVVRRLNGEGKLATIDVLGEEIENPEEAHAIAAAYHEVLERIQAERLDSNISVKLTGFGLALAEDLCRVNLESVVRDARERSTFVRIDMEDSSTTDATLGLYRELRTAGYENVGIVLQSRLRRTLADTAGLDDVRLCKGIYVEPEAIAFQDSEEVRASYVRCLEALLGAGAYVGIATHDELLIGEGLRLVAEHGLRPDQYEFQMLLGVRPQRGDELVRAGHRLRVYVPFGTQWYEYSLRRLQENPQIAGYVAADLFHRLRFSNS